MSKSRSFLLILPLLISIILAKVALPGFAERGLGIGIPLIVTVSLWAFAIGKLEIEPANGLMYALFIFFITITQVFSGVEYSPSSLGLAAAFFLPCALKLSISDAEHSNLRDELRKIVLMLSAIFSLCSIYQQVAQFIGGQIIAFPIENLLPDKLLIKGFNYLIPVSYGSTKLKANGIFFQEPSFYSQFIAIGILFELSRRPNILRLVLLLIGLLVSYSGTGIIVLLFGGVATLLEKKRLDLLLISAAIAPIIFAGADLASNGIFSSRATTITAEGSSGFERFVAWTYMFESQWFPQIGNVLIGAGAGTFHDSALKAPYLPAEMSFSKMLFEFGIIGALLFFGFLFRGIWASKLSLGLKVGLFVSLFLNGPYNPSSLGLLLTLCFWCPQKLQRRADA